jgi:glycosyltransferase involved in cell wall biosynthesis
MSTVVGAIGALGPTAPSFRVRTWVPSAELGRYGVEMRYAPLLSAAEDHRFHSGGVATRARTLLAARSRLARLLEARADWDVALVQRQVDLMPSLRLERLAAQGKRVVLDVDDAIWHDGSAAAGGHPLARLKGTRRKVRWLARRAEKVIAGNERLAEWLSAYSRDVVVIPSLVDHRLVPPRVHNPRERVVLGWLGSPSTARSLNAVAGALTRTAGSLRTTIELRVVGGRAPAVSGIDVRQHPWSPQSERAFLEEVDIGLMPLPDNEWTRGKCAYKALQYMAAGIPVVADEVGMSARVIGHGQGGLIAHGVDDWVEHLVALATDPALRTRLGDAGRQRVERDFSVEAWAPRLAAALSGDDSAAKAETLSYSGAEARLRSTSK